MTINRERWRSKRKSKEKILRYSYKNMKRERKVHLLYNSRLNKY